MKTFKVYTHVNKPQHYDDRYIVEARNENSAYNKAVKEIMHDKKISRKDFSITDIREV